MASHLAIITHKAANDLEDISLYYRLLKPSLELRFMKDVNSVIDRIKAMPTLGSPVESASEQLGRVRCCRLTTFSKYLLFYRTFEKHIEIVRVLHGSRAWQHMLDESD